MSNARFAPFRVVITGHRPNRLALPVEELSRRLTSILSALRSGVGVCRSRVAVSAVAEGSDRIFADAALTLGYDLHALLPFTRDDYLTTFGDATTNNTFDELLAAATQVTELPGTLAASTEAYEAVGHAMVDAADVLVTVWDGQPAAGRGGTPDVIEFALTQRKPVVWVHAAQFGLPRLIKPGAHNPQPPLEKLAARAKSLNRRQIARLATSTL